MWHSLLDYGRLEWQRTVHDFEKARDVDYDNVLNEFDSVWCVQGLIVTRRNLSVTRKVTLRMGIISRVPTFLRRCSRGGLYLSFPCNWISFQFLPKKGKIKLNIGCTTHSCHCRRYIVLWVHTTPHYLNNVMWDILLQRVRERAGQLPSSGRVSYHAQTRTSRWP